ncbi:MAG: YceI family protein, partial [Candidatus Eremiobacteraeota bacterium]|nr:YceI family protein [Candidatus Eremiobacteraeota bacterium]
MHAYRSVSIALITVMALAVAARAADQPRAWVADPRHSSAQFTITHLGISHVRGVIPIVSAVISGDSPQLPARITAKLDPSG